MSWAKLLAPVLALTLTLTAVLAPARAAYAEGEGFEAIPIAVAGGVVAGGLVVLDLTMLGLSIADGRSASLPWELLGLGLGAAGLGVGTVLLLADSGSDGTAMGAVGLGLGVVLVGGAVWSLTLPDAAPAVALVPTADARGLALVGRF